MMHNLFLKIQKGIGIDLAYLIKNGSWVSLRFFILAVGGWLVSIFFTRFSSKELLGQYQFIISLISMITVFSLPGLNAAALESIAKGKFAGVIRAVKLSFLFSLVGIPILLGYGFFNIFIKDNLLLGSSLIFAGIISPLYYSLNTWSVYYEGQSLFKKSSLRIIILNIVLNFLLIIGIISKLNVLDLIIIFLTVNTAFFGYYFWEVFKKIKNLYDDYIDVKFGISVSIQKFVYSFSSNLPPLAISFIFGVEWVAIFYIAYYVISSITAFLGNIITLYLPKLFKGCKLNHKSIILQNIFIGFIFWLIFIIFLKFLFLLIYGNDYLLSLKLSYQISFLLFLIPLKNYIVSYFMTKKRNWMLITIICIANLFSLIILYFLRSLEFSKSIPIYLYSREIIAIIPLIINYIFVVKKEKILSLNNKTV